MYMGIWKMGFVLRILVEEGGVEGQLPGVIDDVIGRLDLKGDDRRLFPGRVK